MSNALSGKKIAILVENGFEQSEMTSPKAALEQAGAQVDIVSSVKDEVKGWQKGNWGDAFAVDVPLEQASPQQYTALVLPGGVMNPDYLRLNNKAIEFIKFFVQQQKPIAAICHGPWTLINAGAVKGRKMTSWPSIKLDLINAGAEWVDQEVVQDGQLITSRKPDDLPAFNQAMIALFSQVES
ncbi:MAG: type 1 glutamine amidotransferase domain-containing protein [Gammaproteobacteria bacterium]